MKNQATKDNFCNIKHGDRPDWGCGCICANKARVHIDRCTDDMPIFKNKPKHFAWKWVCMAPIDIDANLPNPTKYVYLQNSEHCVCELFRENKDGRLNSLLRRV
jgi:hypothetical protein